MAKHTTKQPPSHAKPAPPKRKFYDEEDETETEVETTEPTPPPAAAKEAPWDVPPEPPVPAPPPPVDVVRRTVEDELATPTPREAELADLAKKNAQIGPQRYDITSKNPKALRVIHDYSGRPIEFQPGQTRTGVWLQPQTAEMLGRGDLEVKPSA